MTLLREMALRKEPGVVVGGCRPNGKAIVTVLKVTAHNGSNANAPPGSQLAPSQTKVICMG